MVVRPSRRPPDRSWVGTTLSSVAVLLGVSGVLTLISIPSSPGEWAVVTAVSAVIAAIRIALEEVWERLTRKRRQYRNTG